MTALLLSFLTNPTMLAIMGGVVAALVAYIKGGIDAASKERAKREAEEAKARDIADDVQSDVGAMSADQVRAELAKRTRP
ncbi:hypothetical protein J1C56_08975 [Aminobacter anthyllidis]|uniref:Uncharacterized protein n=1 Tax=Aminobacter anthyllidis TaxID=1035067 RepID=A0A9X1A9F0_9HYPH|nr:hypothetical protein [Aminobacter anthyllidis]MBT1155723.1 hypothetical protein [Aminobacter anthyllidis]